MSHQCVDITIPDDGDSRLLQTTHHLPTSTDQTHRFDELQSFFGHNSAADNPISVIFFPLGSSFSHNFSYVLFSSCSLGFGELRFRIVSDRLVSITIRAVNKRSFILLKCKRPNTLTARNVRLSNLLVSSCFLIFVVRAAIVKDSCVVGLSVEPHFIRQRHVCIL